MFPWPRPLSLNSAICPNRSKVAISRIRRVKTRKMYNQSHPNCAHGANTDPYFNYHYMLANAQTPEQIMMMAYEEQQKMHTAFLNFTYYNQFSTPPPTYPYSHYQTPPPIPISQSPIYPPPTHPTPPNPYAPPPNIQDSSLYRRDGRQARIPYTQEQSDGLNARFRESDTIKQAERIKLAAKIGLTEKQIKIWFQNKRHKLRVDARVARDNRIFGITVAGKHTVTPQKASTVESAEDADETRD